MEDVQVHFTAANSGLKGRRIRLYPFEGGSVTITVEKIAPAGRFRKPRVRVRVDAGLGPTFVDLGVGNKITVNPSAVEVGIEEALRALMDA